MNPIAMIPTASGARDASATLESAGAPGGADKAAPGAPSAEVLKAAREFEGIFLRTMLSSLQKTTKLGSNSTLSAGQSTYGSMVVGAMADAVSTAGGVGLAEVIARALTVRASGENEPTSAHTSAQEAKPL